MSDLDLQSLPVPVLCAPDCACFMWVTYPKLAEGLALMAAWGFTYKTVAFTWVKRNRLQPSWFMGMGRWTRANAEICILGTKGRPVRVNAGVHSIIDAAIGVHSAKPAEARVRIEQLLGKLPSIELFARGDQDDGWDRWGNTPHFDPNGAQCFPESGRT